MFLNYYKYNKDLRFTHIFKNLSIYQFINRIYLSFLLPTYLSISTYLADLSEGGLKYAVHPSQIVQCPLPKPLCH